MYMHKHKYIFVFKTQNYFLFTYERAFFLFTFHIDSFVPESASWLVSAGRIEDAIDNLVKMARFNGKKDVSEAEFKTLLVSFVNSGYLINVQLNTL